MNKADSALAYIASYIRFFQALIKSERQTENGLSAELKLLAEEIIQRESAAGELPLLTIKKTLSLSDSAYFCLCLSLGCELDGNLRNEVQAFSGSPIPTFDLGCGLYARQNFWENPIEMISIISRKNSKLRFLFKDNGEIGLLMLSPMLLRENITYYALTGQVQAGEYHRVFYGNPTGFLPLHADLMKSVCDYINAGDGSCFCISGNPASGKKALIRQACASLALPCIMVSCSDIGDMGAEDIVSLGLEISIGAALSGGAVCLCNYAVGFESRLNLLLKEVPTENAVFILSDAVDSSLPPTFGRTLLYRSLGALSFEDYQLMQERLRAKYNTCVENFPEYYRLTVGELEAAFAEASLICKEQGRGQAGLEDFAMAVRSIKSKPPFVRSVDSNIALADLVVEKATSDKLNALCDFVRIRRSNIGKKHGFTALFYGGSGTGKTMAASAVANRLGLELLKIDISRIMDKYIGETEKHISEVFTAAGERGSILFFDEADALFSKRTQVESSHDRYANVETSFLLQSIEEYDGVVLLATNLFGNFDEAFLRRIHLIVHFSMPNREQRLKLWQGAFNGAKLSKNIDLVQLAAELELSPAAIVGVAEMASALCKDEITGADIRYALENEMLKCGKPIAIPFGIDKE